MCSSRVGGLKPCLTARLLGHAFEMPAAAVSGASSIIRLGVLIDSFFRRKSLFGSIFGGVPSL